jgi:probable F420-dependent oxidoreductase
MTSTSGLKFSIQMPEAPSASAWTDKVRRAEDSGFHSISVPDHLGPSLPQLAPMVALAAAAMVTSTIRLAITVLDNDFRHPVMVAKEIATLDLLSEGRVDMGLGAGWLAEDYTTTGISPWDAPGRRVDRLIESIHLLRMLLSGEVVTYNGEHYQVDGFRSIPLPVQTRVPLLIGACQKRMLTLAAKEADIVHIIENRRDGDRSEHGLQERLRWIADAGGLARDDLTLGIRVLVGEVTPAGRSRREAADDLANRWGRPAEDLLDSPYSLLGDHAAVKDHLLGLHDRHGITYFTISEDLAWQVAPVVAQLS